MSITGTWQQIRRSFGQSPPALQGTIHASALDLDQLLGMWNLHGSTTPKSWPFVDHLPERFLWLMDGPVVDPCDESTSNKVGSVSTGTVPLFSLTITLKITVSRGLLLQERPDSSWLTLFLNVFLLQPLHRSLCIRDRRILPFVGIRIKSYQVQHPQYRSFLSSFRSKPSTR